MECLHIIKKTHFKHNLFIVYLILLTQDKRIKEK